MTRKLTRKTPSFRGIAPFIAVLTVLIALAALAQRTGPSQSFGNGRIAAQAGDPSPMAQELVVWQQPDATAPANTAPLRSQALISTPRLFKLSGTYGSGGQYASWVAMADVNADGKPDLLVANICASGSNCTEGTVSNNGTVSVLVGNGDGTFKTAVPYYAGGFYATSVAVADVNRDGKADLLVSICGDGSCNDPSVGVLLGNGDGTFQQAVVYSSGGSGGGRVTVADVNGDGKPDILIPNSGTTVGVLLGNGDGTFQLAVSYGSGGIGPGSIAVADVNDDGKPDLLVANHCPTSTNGFCPNSVVGVLLGNGDGTFQTAVPYPSGGFGSSSVSVGDVNGDGKPDLVVSNDCISFKNCYQGSVGVLVGNGDGSFQAVQTYSSVGNDAVDVAVADVNADHKADLLVVDNGGCTLCVTGRVGVLLGNGNGTFQPTVLYGTGGYRATSIAVGDINGDGKPDAVAANFCSSNSDCATGTVGILLAVRAPTATLVTTSGSPSLVTQPVTFTAMVTSQFGNIPDGELVTFLDGTTAIGSGTTLSGVAKFSTSTLTAKTHTIKATYPGDAIFKPSSGTVTQAVNKYPTTTTLHSSLNPSQFGQTVTFTAHVTSTGPAPTGTVRFLGGTTGIGYVTVSGGVAKLTKSNLAVGTHPITAHYNGDAASGTSTSPVVNQGITPRPTKTVVSTSGSPSLVGQPVTFTALVTSTLGAIPNGELVTFYNGTTEIGTNLTKSGVATFTTSSLKVGTHSIKATYAGDVHFKSSTGAVQQVVEKYPTTTTLTSSLNPSQFGQAVTFTAHVTSTGPAPTGKVQFLDGTTSIGYTTLSGGVAKLAKSNLAVGTHPITAHYNGDANSSTSTSTVVNQVVQ